MRIKNISAATIKFPEFDLVLRPGDEADLSKFDPMTIGNHPTLTNYFQKGILINLGFAKTTGTKQRLNSARARIEKLNLNDNFVVKEKDPSFEKEKKVKKTERKEVLKKPSIKQELERYKHEFLQNKDPANFNPDDLEKPKPRVKVQKTLSNMMIGTNGTWQLEDQLAPGVIFSKELVGETTFLAIEHQKEPKKSIKDNEILIDLQNQTLSLDFDKIKHSINSMCSSFQANGKPCGRKKVNGFETCTHHMTDEEKIAYQQAKEQAELLNES